jgi:hypothetical protein
MKPARSTFDASANVAERVGSSKAMLTVCAAGSPVRPEAESADAAAGAVVFAAAGAHNPHSTPADNKTNVHRFNIFVSS